MAIYLPLSDEQQFLSEAAADALARHDTVAAAREVLDGAPRADLWPVAVDTGWTGLLSAEGADGAELGPFEAALVLQAAGRRLADLGLLGHLPATLLLEDAGDLDLRRALASGERRAALVDGELTHGSAPLTASVDGDELVLTGTATGVIDAPGADVLVVVTAVGVSVIEQTLPKGSDPIGSAEACYDGTRRIGTVSLDGVRARRLDVAAPERGRDLQRLLLAAESLGAAEACLTMARDYAVDRHAFGRAIGSYQAIKHKLVEMLRRIENTRSLVARSGATADATEVTLIANAARVAAAGALDYCAPESIFIHGGVGATWEHDASLYYRRAEVSRRLAGGVEEAARTVASTLLAEPGVASEAAVSAMPVAGSTAA